MKIPQANLNLSLITACIQNDLSTIRKLLTNKDGNRAEIKARGNDPLKYACKYAYLDIIKYLLTSKELDEHANIHENDDEVFRILLIECSKPNNSGINIIEYLIFDYNLTKTKDIEEALNFDYSNIKIKKQCEKVIKMFEVRDIKLKIETQLQQNNSVSLSSKNKL